MAGLGYTLFTAGQVLTAAQVNGYLQQQAVMVFATTAARDSALTSVKSEGMVTYQLDNNDLDIYNGTTFSTLVAPAHGALTTWTPAVVQGVSVTTTNNGSTYLRIGRFIWGRFLVAPTSTGTAANIVTVSVPVTASTSDGNTKVGLGDINDASIPAIHTNAVLSLNSATTMAFVIAGSAATRQTLGTTQFTAALTTGDALNGTFMFEASADA